MSTQKSKLASDEHDSIPISGEHPAALRYPADAPRRLSEPESSGFSGTCQNASLADWIQLVQMGRRDAVIGVRSHDGRKGMLWCHDGDIIDAWCDGLLGEDAVYLALSWEGGYVSVAFVACERPRRILLSTAALLLRAAHRRDSGVRELSRAARTSSIPSAPRHLSAPPAAAVRSVPPVSTPPSPSAESVAPSSSPAAHSPDRRARRRLAALVGVALVVLLALALSLTRSSSQRAGQKASTPALIKPEAKPAVIPANPATDVAPAAPEPAATKSEAKNSALPARRALSAPRSAAAPQTRNTNAGGLEATEKRSPKTAKVRPGPQIIEDRAPRVQIIDERDSQIEVIQ